MGPYLRFLLFICIALQVTGCNQTLSSRQNIKTAQTTNSVALSNLDLGIAYMKQGDYEKALEKLMRAKKADPNYSATYNVLGLLHQQLGELDKAETYFKKAIRLNDADSSTLNNYGRLLCQQDKLEDAEAIFLRAADNPLYETPEIAIANAGLCAYSNDRTEDAEIYFRQALQINPLVPPALLSMAEITFADANYLSAQGYVQRYHEIAKHTPKSLWLGIQIENQLGNKDAVSSYALLLKNTFPESKETALLREAKIQ